MRQGKRGRAPDTADLCNVLQELKAIKLGQKDHARNLTQLQRNVTAVLGGLALEVDFLATRLNRLDPPVAALLPPENESGAPATVGGNDNLNCSAGEVLDFRETEHGPADIPSPVRYLGHPYDIV